MFKIYQDSMAITLYFKHPDVFKTFQTKLEWSKITSALLQGHTNSDRPNLVACVFHMNALSLLRDITRQATLGRIVGHIYTIEFQKQGLPHMHLLIFFGVDNKMETAADVHRIICGEFPDLETDPLQFQTILHSTIYNSCGTKNQIATSMVDEIFCKSSLKALQGQITMDGNMYPLYQRRNKIRLGYKKTEFLLIIKMWYHTIHSF